MSNSLKVPLGFLLAVGLLAGCGKTTNLTTAMNPVDATGDQALVANELSANPSYVDDGVYATEDASSTAALSGLSPESAIQPITFWRQINRHRTSYDFAFSDSDSVGRPIKAIVTVNQSLSGTFNILTVPPVDSVFERHVVKKRLHELWVRKVLLERVWYWHRGHLRSDWKIAGTSGVSITSDGAATRIASLRVQSGVFDSTVTDPFGFFRLRHIVHLDPNAQVTLTVTTLRNDDVVVLVHRARRFALHNNGDNTYTGVFSAGTLLGVQHAGVNALSRGSIYDDTAAYDSQAWLIPYVVHPLDLASWEP